MLNQKVDISPPSAELVDLAGDIDSSRLGTFKDENFVKVYFRMEIGDLVDSSIMQLYPIRLAKELYRKFSSNQEAAPEVSATEPAKPEPSVNQQVQPQTVQQPMGQQPMGQQPMMGANTGQPMMGMNMNQGMPYGYVPPAQDLNVQPVQFQPFSVGYNPVTQQENIDLIMDVPLEVTVELGRTHKSIKEILEFGPGTIIELDKIAGEPIDVLVNGKLVAKGEVVVIEESFGVRVTDIIK